MSRFFSTSWAKNILLFCIIIVSLSAESCKNENTKKAEQYANETVFYFIRHAEKDRSDTTNTNPKLTQKGLQRALGWSNYFDSIPLQKIYSTPYNRTVQTATPTAAKKQLEILEYRPDTIISEAFINANKGTNVLIVGHSNTTPYLVNALLKEDRYQDMLDHDNYSLYKVTLFENLWEAEVLTINK